MVKELWHAEYCYFYETWIGDCFGRAQVALRKDDRKYINCFGKQTLKWEIDVQTQSQSTRVRRVCIQVWADTLRETSSWLETGGHKSIQKLSKSIYILVWMRPWQSCFTKSIHPNLIRNSRFSEFIWLSFGGYSS